MIYAIPYIILVLVYAALASYNKNCSDDFQRKNIDIICIMIMFFFFGFRGYICDDWQVYYVYFRDVTFENVNFNLFEVNNGWIIEPGFTLLMLICKSVIDHYQFLVIVCSAINIVLLYKFLRKYSIDIPLGFMIFICMGGFGLNTNLMRNSISILIFTNSLQYISDRKPLKYFALCCVAFLFHRTAIFYFPLYFFLHRKINKWVFLGIILIGNLIVILHIPTVSYIVTHYMSDLGNVAEDKVDSYAGGNMDNSAFRISIGYLERMFTAFLFFCYYNKLIKIRKANIMFLNSFTLYFTMFFFLSEMDTLSIRMSMLFTYCYWILWVDLLQCFEVRNNRLLFSVFLAIYCVMKIAGQTNMKTTEYDNVLFGAKSYDERLYLYNKYHTESK